MNSKSHKHKIQDGTVVKVYEFIELEKEKMNFILIDTIKDCRNKYFHSFKKKVCK